MANEIILDWNVYIEKAVEAVSEGIVMLKNDGALPLRKGEKVAVFGRIQHNYYKSGTGSGGMVNVSRVIGITDALIECGEVEVNAELCEIYKSWSESNPFDYGVGWGGEPWSQNEMPLGKTLAEKISKESETAIVIIGRTAGEELDNKIEKGAFLLSDNEEIMMATVRAYFKKVIVLLNVGGLLDMSFIDKYSPDSVLYVWQGGMIGGLGTADILTGKTSPSGKLTDTIAFSVLDYPSTPYFGDKDRNFYCEDIYVGYRYFETFAKNKVRFPFGFGLSYTSFSVIVISHSITENKVSFIIDVENIGSCSGKEVVQIYCEAPQGRLGKPFRVLCGYEKTIELRPNEKQRLSIDVCFSVFASFDDSDNSEYKSCLILEAGLYNFYVGTDVRSAKYAGNMNISQVLILSKLSAALTPILQFKRFKPLIKDDEVSIEYEDVPYEAATEEQRRLASLPSEISYTGDLGIKLEDVLSGKKKLEQFIAQLSDYDLSCIIRGEGMCSKKVTPGTAAAFGGVSNELSFFGIPCVCCADGPSGMRFDSGTRAFSLPIGTLLASTFNKQLISELFTFTGLEMRANDVDCLLAPGMNIHRHPLNGRNFEYFSEDPFLTGMTAAAVLNGLNSAGVYGTVKHFCANNQETCRHGIDSIVSERALREIYLKGFEIALRKEKAAVMTSYGSVNGLWTAGSFDLTTTILRKDWDFSGFVMTDWWANINRRGKPVDKKDFASMAKAQNDVYMVCADGSNNDDNTLKALQSGDLTRGELQRNAANILRFVMTTPAMKRICNSSETVEIINRDDFDKHSNLGEVPCYQLEAVLSLPLEKIKNDKGSMNFLTLEVKEFGDYIFSITAGSENGELEQIPVTLFSMSAPIKTFIWNGTGGKPVSFATELNLFSRFTSIRLYFGQSGLKLHKITFEKKRATTESSLSSL